MLEEVTRVLSSVFTGVLTCVYHTYTNTKTQLSKTFTKVCFLVMLLQYCRGYEEPFSTGESYAYIFKTQQVT